MRSGCYGGYMTMALSYGEEMKMRTAIYARCSTDQQNPSMQLSELREYASRRGLEVIGEFTDFASGSQDARPELAKVLTLVRQRRIDCVLCWKIDRLGRSLRHLVNTLAELEAVGVAFISYKDALDFTTPAGRLMFGVIAAMAQFERDLIRERVKAGMADAKRRGVKLGRQPVRIDREEVKRLRAEGLSFARIARQLGVSVGTAHKAATTTAAISA
jgi:DNA invertase Pin-like site-specific DNA recombinase